MQTIRLAILALTASAAVPLAADAPPAKAHAESDSKRAPVTRASASADMEVLFNGFDQDHDGAVTQEEWLAPGNSDPGASKEDAMRAFHRIDSDQNSLLSKQETIDWGLRMYDCLDQDHNGSLIESEAEPNFEHCVTNVGGLSMPPDAKR